MKILQIQPNIAELSETFVEAHSALLPADHVLHGYPPQIAGSLVLDRRRMSGVAALERY